MKPGSSGNSRNSESLMKIWMTLPLAETLREDCSEGWLDTLGKPGKCGKMLGHSEQVWFGSELQMESPSLDWCVS